MWFLRYASEQKDRLITVGMYTVIHKKFDSTFVIITVNKLV